MKQIDNAKLTVSGKTSHFLSFYIKKHIPLIIAAVLMSLTGSLLTIFIPDFLARITDKIQEGISLDKVSIDVKEIGRLSVILIIISVMSMLMNYIQSLILNRVSMIVGQSLRADLKKKIDRLSLGYFDKHNYGDVLGYFTNDVNTFSQVIMKIGSFAQAIILFFGCIIMMFISEWRLTLISLAATFLGFIGMGILLLNGQKYFDALQHKFADVNQHIEEYYTAHSVIRNYNAEKQCMERFSKKNRIMTDNLVKAGIVESLTVPIMTFTSNLGYISVCVVGALLALKGSINFTVIVAFILYVKLIATPMEEFGGITGQLQRAIAAVKRIDSFFGQEELIDESRKTERLDNVNGNVKFSNVNFGYLPGKLTIKDFSLEVKPGQKIAIVGPTGAGKTTIVNLLMRFYELNSGSITVDGTSLANITRENAHRLFGMVLQDTWLFSGTLRENLAYVSCDVTDEEIMKACQKCGIDHFVNSLPKGLDTVFDENMTISAGQKQLLTIVRAMIENAPMMILDEATSSVDTRTELLIQRSFDRLLENRTCFVIAHRLCTIRNADKIIYMNDGVIEEIGTHDELIARNGAYAELYNSQFITI